MHFEWLEIDDATPAFIDRWSELGCSAESPNIYVMPEFVLPAVRHLEADKSPMIAALWNVDRAQLLALGVFNAVAPSWRFPYWRLSAVKSKHSFQSGVLLRAGIGSNAVDRFIAGLFAKPWRAVRFNDFRKDTAAYQQLQEGAQRLGLKWFVDGRYERAHWAVDDPPWRDVMPKSRHKRLQRARAKLAQLGKVEFRIISSDDVSDATIETFLRLESLGWKAGSALLATAAGTQFFRDLIAAARQQHLLFFYELLLNDQVIATTSNFLIGGHGFAFKIGNDPTYAKFSPGYLVEYAFLETCTDSGLPLHEIESGAEPGSFMETLWPGRVAMLDGHFVAAGLPSAYALLKQWVKRLRRVIPRQSGR